MPCSDFWSAHARREAQEHRPYVW